MSQAVVVDSSGNSYIAGWDTYVCYQEGSFIQCNEGLLTLKYDQNGNQLWINIPQTIGLAVRVVGLAVDAASNFYVAANDYDYNNPYLIFLFSSSRLLNICRFFYF
jgi:hypothetical protein